MSFRLPVQNLETNVSMTRRHVKVSLRARDLPLKHAAHVTRHCQFEDGWKREWRQMKRAAKIRTAKAVAEARWAIFWPTLGVKGRLLDSFGSILILLISSPTVNCQGMLRPSAFKVPSLEMTVDSVASNSLWRFHTEDFAKSVRFTHERFCKRAVGMGCNWCKCIKKKKSLLAGSSLLYQLFNLKAFLCCCFSSSSFFPLQIWL